jgi:hypothetical protein
VKLQIVGHSHVELKRWDCDTVAARGSIKGREQVKLIVPKGNGLWVVGEEGWTAEGSLCGANDKDEQEAEVQHTSGTPNKIKSVHYPYPCSGSLPLLHFIPRSVLTVVNRRLHSELRSMSEMGILQQLAVGNSRRNLDFSRQSPTIAS